MPKQIGYARRMRKTMTLAESRLWHGLRNHALGVKFRRQAVIGEFIVDFVCFDRRVVVEVDGSQHFESAYDSRRDAWLAGQGFRVMRFWNDDVVRNLEGVVEMIREAVEAEVEGLDA